VRPGILCVPGDRSSDALMWVHVFVGGVLSNENPDRGEIVNAAIVIGVLAAGAIMVGAILIAKAKSAATNVKTQ